MKIAATAEIQIAGASRWDRLVALFGHLDSRVYFQPGIYLDVGAGSLDVARRVQAIMADRKGCIGRIGRYTESANATILSGGGHANDRVVNVGFGAIPIIRMLNPHHDGLDPTPLIDIGSGVVISEGAVVLPGVSVGDGAVIGAGAVVTKAAEAFGIYAGVPARRLRGRFPPNLAERVRRVAWWNFAPGYIAANLAEIQSLALLECAHPYLPHDGARVVISIAEGVQIPKIVGLAWPSGSAHIQDCHPAFQAYVAQASGPGPFQWKADPFS